MIATRAACSVSTSASSRAESPPPMTQTSWPAKKWPSQEAQCDTPRPRNASSPGTPSERERWSPAATITARALSVFGCAVDDAPVAVDGDALDGVEHEFRAGGFGLLVQQRAELGAGQALRKAGKVLDALGGRDLAADAHALDHRHAQAAAARRASPRSARRRPRRSRQGRIPAFRRPRLCDLCEARRPLYARWRSLRQDFAVRRRRQNDENKNGRERDVARLRVDRSAGVMMLAIAGARRGRTTRWRRSTPARRCK